MDILTLKR